MLKSALILLLGLCLALTGCTTTHNIPFSNLQGNQAPAISPGESVRVTLKSGQVRRLKVAVVDAETITGRDLDAKDSGTSIQIALADVQALHVREFEGKQTFWLVFGVVAGVLTIAYYGMASAQCGASLDDCGD
jgi:hypothetical protein